MIPSYFSSKESDFILGSNNSPNLKLLVDTAILSTDGDDEGENFCQKYKPTFMNEDFVNSNQKLWD